MLVYVRFQDETPGYIRVADALVGTQIYAEQYSDSEIIVQKAYANQKLRLYLINTCDEEIYYDISRVSEDASDQNVLNISPELGKLLEKYVARQVPLGEFLATDMSVSDLEKLAFYQKFALDSRPLGITRSQMDHLFIKNAWPEVVGDFDRNTVCKCSTLVVSPQHTVGVMTGGVFPWHYAWEQALINKEEAKQDAGEGTKFWIVGRVLGAARWQALHTEGYRKKKTHEVIKTYGIGIQTSGVRGEIGAHLLCMNGNQLPESCECDKTGFFSYRYDTKIDAHAVVHNGGLQQGWRKSSAQTQEMALAFFYYGGIEDGVNVDELFPVKGINIQASASCDSEINPAFWSNVEDVGNSAIDVFTDNKGKLLFQWRYTYRYDTTFRDSIIVNPSQNPPTTDTIKLVQQIDTVVVDSFRYIIPTDSSQIYKDLLSSIVAVIKTSYLDSIKCSGETWNEGMFGFTQFKLRPNKPVKFILMSMGKNRATGRRSWYSRSSIVSGYNMVVVIRPGKTDGPEADCCTPWTGAYLVGSPFFDEASMNRDATSDLVLFAAFGLGDPNGLALTNTGAAVRGQSGYMHRPADDADCTVPATSRSGPANPTHDLTTIEAAMIANGATVRVFHIAGNLLGSFDLRPGVSDPMVSIRRQIAINLPKNAMYVVHIQSGSESLSFKLFNTSN